MTLSNPVSATLGTNTEHTYTISDNDAAPMIAFNSVFEDNKGESETIAGFVLEISGSFPKRNTKIKFKNYLFTIEALDKKRIKRLKLTIS